VNVYVLLNKLLIPIVVPLPPTPANDLTAASFKSIVAVADRPSSVLTWLSAKFEPGSVIF
jgi:hypothetical protein